MKAGLACIERLEKEQEFLKKRGKDMLRRGLKTLDELDVAEENEQEEERRRASKEYELAKAANPHAPTFDDPSHEQMLAFSALYPDVSQ